MTGHKLAHAPMPPSTSERVEHQVNSWSANVLPTAKGMEFRTPKDDPGAESVVPSRTLAASAPGKVGIGSASFRRHPKLDTARAREAERPDCSK